MKEKMRVKGKRAGALTLATTVAMLPLGVKQKTIFAMSDIEGHWAENLLQSWKNANLISGYEDGSFRPDVPVTRAEFVHMLNKAVGYDYAGSISFSDVSPSDWFYNSVAIAVGEGYASGMPNGTFEPNSIITRAQAAVFGYNAANQPQTETGLTYTDTGDIPSWAYESVAGMTSEGYLSGFNGAFRPNDSMTRAEAVSFIERMRKDLVGTELPDYSTETEVEKEETELEKEETEVEKEESLYEPDDNTYTISAGGTTLEDQIINGDLYISSTTRDGNIKLAGVKIKGDVYVEGGGTILFDDVEVTGKVVMNKSNATLNITGTTIVSDIEVIKYCHIDSYDYNRFVGRIIFMNDISDAYKTIVDVPVTTMLLKGKINLSLESEIYTLVVSELATGSTIDTTSNVKISLLVADGAFTLTGRGTIGIFEINANGVVVDSTIVVDQYDINKDVTQQPIIVTPAVPGEDAESDEDVFVDIAPTSIAVTNLADLIYVEELDQYGNGTKGDLQLKFSPSDATQTDVKLVLTKYDEILYDSIDWSKISITSDGVITALNGAIRDRTDATETIDFTVYVESKQVTGLLSHPDQPVNLRLTKNILDSTAELQGELNNNTGEMITIEGDIEDNVHVITSTSLPIIIDLASNIITGAFTIEAPNCPSITILNSGVVNEVEMNVTSMNLPGGIMGKTTFSVAQDGAIYVKAPVHDNVSVKQGQYVEIGADIGGLSIEANAAGSQAVVLTADKDQGGNEIGNLSEVEVTTSTRLMALSDLGVVIIPSTSSVGEITIFEGVTIKEVWTYIKKTEIDGDGTVEKVKLYDPEIGTAVYISTKGNEKYDPVIVQVGNLTAGIIAKKKDENGDWVDLLVTKQLASPDFTVSPSNVLIYGENTAIVSATQSNGSAYGIFYTLNGSDPNQSSPKFTTAKTMDRGTSNLSNGYNEGPSAPVEQAYLFRAYVDADGVTTDMDENVEPSDIIEFTVTFKIADLEAVTEAVSVALAAINSGLYESNDIMDTLKDLIDPSTIKALDTQTKIDNHVIDIYDCMSGLDIRDTTAPIVSQITATRLDDTSGVVTFIANEPGYYQIFLVENGGAPPRTIDYDNMYEVEYTEANKPIVTETITDGIMAGVEYDIYLLVKDYSGNIGVSSKADLGIIFEEYPDTTISDFIASRTDNTFGTASFLSEKSGSYKVVYVSEGGAKPSSTLEAFTAATGNVLATGSDVKGNITQMVTLSGVPDSTVDVYVMLKDNDNNVHVSTKQTLIGYTESEIDVTQLYRSTLTSGRIVFKINSLGIYKIVQSKTEPTNVTEDDFNSMVNVVTNSTAYSSLTSANENNYADITLTSDLAMDNLWIVVQKSVGIVPAPYAIHTTALSIPAPAQNVSAIRMNSNQAQVKFTPQISGRYEWVSMARQADGSDPEAPTSISASSSFLVDSDKGDIISRDDFSVGSNEFVFFVLQDNNYKIYTEKFEIGGATAPSSPTVQILNENNTVYGSGSGSMTVEVPSNPGMVFFHIDKDTGVDYKYSMSGFAATATMAKAQITSPTLNGTQSGNNNVTYSSAVTLPTPTSETERTLYIEVIATQNGETSVKTSIAIEYELGTVSSSGGVSYQADNVTRLEEDGVVTFYARETARFTFPTSTDGTTYKYSLSPLSSTKTAASVSIADPSAAGVADIVNQTNITYSNVAVSLSHPDPDATNRIQVLKYIAMKDGVASDVKESVIVFAPYTAEEPTLKFSDNLSVVDGMVTIPNETVAPNFEITMKENTTYEYFLSDLVESSADVLEEERTPDTAYSFGDQVLLEKPEETTDTSRTRVLTVVATETHGETEFISEALTVLIKFADDKPATPMITFTEGEQEYNVVQDDTIRYNTGTSATFEMSSNEAVAYKFSYATNLASIITPTAEGVADHTTNSNIYFSPSGGGIPVAEPSDGSGSMVYQFIAVANYEDLDNPENNKVVASEVRTVEVFYTDAPVVGIDDVANQVKGETTRYITFTAPASAVAYQVREVEVLDAGIATDTLAKVAKLFESFDDANLNDSYSAGVIENNTEEPIEVIAPVVVSENGNSASTYLYVFLKNENGVAGVPYYDSRISRSTYYSSQVPADPSSHYEFVVEDGNISGDATEGYYVVGDGGGMPTSLTMQLGSSANDQALKVDTQIRIVRKDSLTVVSDDEIFKNGQELTYTMTDGIELSLDASDFDSGSPVTYAVVAYTVGGMSTELYEFDITYTSTMPTTLDLIDYRDVNQETSNQEASQEEIESAVLTTQDSYELITAGIVAMETESMTADYLRYSLY